MPYTFVSVPTFAPSMATLVMRLKLDGSNVPGAMAEIDTAVQSAALGFFRRLGASRLATIQAITYVDVPVTENDYLRLMGAITEYHWVRLKLIKKKPQLFLDAGAKALQLFNDEGAFRPVSLKSIEQEIDWLSHEVEDGLLALQGGVLLQETEINVTTFHPKHRPDLPGATAFPARRFPPFRGYWPTGGFWPSTGWLP